MGVTVFCQRCGSAIEADAQYCGGCGARQEAVAEVRPSLRPAPVSVQPATSPYLASPSTTQPTNAHAGAGVMWLRRAGATIVDGFVVLLPATVVSYLLMFAAIAQANESNLGAVLSSVVVLSFVPTIAYCVYASLLMSRTGERNGQTLGKHAFGIRVVRTDGRPVTGGSALVRETVVKGVVFGGVGILLFYLPLLLDCLWPLWDERQQALHDKLVNTRVSEA